MELVAEWIKKTTVINTKNYKTNEIIFTQRIFNYPEFLKEKDFKVSPWSNKTRDFLNLQAPHFYNYYMMKQDILQKLLSIKS